MSIETTDSMPRPTTATLLWHAARYHIGVGRGFVALGAIVLILGAVLNWSWLVAAGVAPLLLSALPCLIMCALGLCASKAINGSCGSSSRAQSPDGSPSEAPPRSIAPPIERASSRDLRAPEGSEREPPSIY
jgi:hypothetical protein